VNGGFSILALVVWLLVLAAILGIARVVSWRPLRIVINLFGLLLVGISVWNIATLFF
jgi:hypothetical protein